MSSASVFRPLNLRYGFATLPLDLEREYGGDWNHSGIYALHHIPTGLEYVGASACVKERLKAHAANPAAWKKKLQACIAVIEHGPQVIRTERRTFVLHSVGQIAGLHGGQLPVSELEALGLVRHVDRHEIIPLFLEQVEPHRLLAAEIEHVEARRPALNSVNHVYYNGGVGGAVPSGPPPRCPPVEIIRALPIREAVKRLEELRSTYRWQLRQSRYRLGRAMEAIAAEKAERAAEALYRREMNRMDPSFEYATADCFRAAFMTGAAIRLVNEGL